MKETKTEFKWFTIMQWREEQEYLRAKHNDGWALSRIGFPGFYHFDRCEAEDVVYQLDYNPEGLAHKSEYVQMFRDCGWEYMMDFVGYSYFKKPADKMNGNEEIFCDDTSRLDMMKRVFKGRMTPLLIILFAIIIPQIFMQMGQSSTANQVLAGLYIVLLVVYVVVFASFGLQFWRYAKSLEKL